MTTNYHFVHSHFNRSKVYSAFHRIASWANKPHCTFQLMWSSSIPIVEITIQINFAISNTFKHSWYQMSVQMTWLYVYKCIHGKLLVLSSRCCSRGCNASTENSMRKTLYSGRSIIFYVCYILHHIPYIHYIFTIYPFEKTSFILQML